MSSNAMPSSSTALPRYLARPLVLLAAVLAALVASVVVAGTASAHVTVASEDATPGGYGKLVFRVPNESDTASTIGLRIQIPEEAALASLRTQPVPGWTATLTTSDLDEPLDNHGQEISSYVSVVEFRAEAGSGIAPGEFQEFALSGGPFPDAEQLSFPAVQLYSDGSEAAWIEPSVDGAEPERPAPVLDLAADPADTADGAATATPGAEEAGHAHGEAENEPAGLALFLSILALLAGLGGVVLGWRANRRTVSA
ncbi:YcnI family protein [Blastococcus brunescens]|uniref:YcnI family protein n=1 Tax=Blastococcus brunescens TaxID=1564165 RepID=A0ABZ1B6R7_9ACTN|nr:YcnI family protein [Blastococcus sp. BMG 8361]WRL65089.1 YcnI family protein [Blastococcus sp. BMG 8361]